MGAWCQVLYVSAAGIDDQKVLAALGFEGGPMAIEQGSVDARFDFASGLGVDFIFITPVVRAAFWVDAGLKDDLFSVGRNKQAAGFSGKPGDLANMPSGVIHDPDLRRSAAVGNEINQLRIGGPAGAFVIVAIARQLNRRSAAD